MSTFGASVTLNCDRLLQKTNARCLSVAKELFDSIVNLSPSPKNNSQWADGLLVNQWYPAVGTFSSELSTSTSPYGAASLSRISSLVSDSKEFYGKDGVITLSNNVFYAYRAEALGWPEKDNPVWKNAEPYWMVARSLQIIAARYK